MSRLWDLIQADIDRQKYGGNMAGLARAAGVEPIKVTRWKGARSHPLPPDELQTIAKATGIDYWDLLDAELEDRGYGRRRGAKRLRVVREQDRD